MRFFQKFIPNPLNKFLSLSIKEFIIILILLSVLLVLGHSVLTDIDRTFFSNKISFFFKKSYYFKKVYWMAKSITGLVISVLIFYFLIAYTRDKIIESGGKRNFLFEVLTWALILSVVSFVVIFGGIGFICSMFIVPLIYIGIGYNYRKDEALTLLLSVGGDANGSRGPLII